MSRKGVNVRYFHVVYNPAEVAAHHDFVRNLIARQGFEKFFGSWPVDEDARQGLMFMIEEAEADAYVAHIEAVGRVGA